MLAINWYTVFNTSLLIVKWKFTDCDLQWGTAYVETEVPSVKAQDVVNVPL